MEILAGQSNQNAGAHGIGLKQINVSTCVAVRFSSNPISDGSVECLEVEFLQKRMDENPQYQGLVAFTNLHDPGRG